MIESIERIATLILAGGEGLRLKPVVADRPKVLAPVVGTPFVLHLIKYLGASGIKEVTLCTGFMGDAIELTLGKSAYGVELRYSREACPLGTAGALKLAAASIRNDRILVLNGDSFCPFSPRDLLLQHESKGADVSLLVTDQKDSAQFGKVDFDSDGRVIQFAEKAIAGPGFVNAGVYLINRQILDEIGEGFVSLERDVLPRIVNRRMFAVLSGSVHLDIGTPPSYGEAQTRLPTLLNEKPQRNSGGE